MKFLLVLPIIPLSKSSGGNQAVINMIERMRKEFSLTIVFPIRHHNVKDVETLRQTWPDADLRPFKYWDNDIVTPLFIDDWKFRRNHKKMQKAMCRMLSVFYNQDTSSLDPDKVIRRNSILLLNQFLDYKTFTFFKFIRQIAEEGFDIVQTEFMDYINLAYFLPDNVRKIFVHHELRFVRLENEISLYPDRRLEDDVMLKREEESEIDALRHYDDVIVLTEHDKKILESKYLPNTRIHCSPAVIPQGQPIEFSSCGKEFVFVGGMSHNPNFDGVLWFIKYVLPELRKKTDRFKIHIVGHWDKSVAKKIHKANPEIEFPGYIENIEAFLNGKISIVPIRIGSGMRMKIILAINSMSPFITSGKGVEGQDYMDNEECLIRDDAEGFASAMVTLASDIELQKKMAVAARLKQNELYDTEAIINRRIEIYKVNI